MWVATSTLGLTGGGGTISSLNGQTGATQTFASSTSGTDFKITSSAGVHTFQLPSASALARGLLATADWTSFSGRIASTSLDTSAELASLLGDETGTGLSVFSASPTFSGTINVASAILSSTLSLSGTAANIALGSNWLSGDGGDEGVFIDGAGNVGIGTETPHYSLDIASTSPFFVITDTDGAFGDKNWVYKKYGLQ